MTEEQEHHHGEMHQCSQGNQRLGRFRMKYIQPEARHPYHYREMSTEKTSEKTGHCATYTNDEQHFDSIAHAIEA